MKTAIWIIGLLLVAQQVWAHPDPEQVSPEVAECFGQASREYGEITLELEKRLIEECKEKVKALAPQQEIKAEVERETEAPPSDKNWQALFSDDFEKDLALSWNFFGDWSIKKDETMALEIGGKQPFSTSAGAESWTDYKVSFRYKPIRNDETATLRINFRVDWSHNLYYSLTLSPVEKQLVLEKFTGEKAVVLQQAPFEFNLDSWHNLEITAAEDKIWIIADGKSVMSLKDKEKPLLFGRIRIEAEFTKAPIARIDDFKVVGVFEKPTWEYLHGPVGGKVAKILIDPKNTNNVLLTAEHAAAYKSADGGKTWKNIYKGLNTVDLLVKGFAMSPHDPRIVLAMSSDGPYRTINQGEVWRKVSKITSPDNSAVRGAGRFAFSPSDSKVVYMGTDRDIEEDGATKGGLFLKSTDAGASFIAYPAAAFNKNIRVIAVHPANPDVVFVGTKHEGLWQTSDSGQTWRAINKGLDYKEVVAIEINPANPRQIFAVAGQLLSEWKLLYQSSDGGETWKKAAILFGGEEVKDLVMVKIAPSNPSLVYAASGNKLFVSGNGGATWQGKEIPGAYGIFDIAVDPVNPRKLIVGYYNGLTISEDGGATWQRSVQGLGAHGIISLAVDPTNPAIVYAGDWSYGGIHKSTDYGKTWTDINSGLGENIIPNVQDLTVDSKNPQTLYAALYDRGIFKSTNGGENWQNIIAGLTSLNIAQVVVSPADSNLIYAAATKQVNYFEQSGQANASYGVFKSTNGGAQWTRVSSGLQDASVQTIALHPTNPNIIYAGTALNGLFKSTDGGKTWLAKNTGFAKGDDYIQAIVINPQNPNELYAGIDQIYKSRWAKARTEFVTGGGAVYKSVDGGETWQKLGLDKRVATVEKIAIDPVNPNTVYVSTHSPGVYKSVDSGKTWKPMNMGMLYLDDTYGGHNYVFALESSADGKILYAGGCGRGVFKTAGLLEEAEAPPSAAEVKTVQETKKFPLVFVLVLVAAITVFGAAIVWIVAFYLRRPSLRR